MSMADFTRCHDTTLRPRWYRADPGRSSGRAPGHGTTFGTFKGNPEAKAVTGLGDEAVWLPAYAAVELHVLKGATLLSLAVGTLSGVPIDGFPSDMTPDQLLDMAKKLGTLALARL